MTRISTSSWSLHRALGSPPLFGPGQPFPANPSADAAISLLDLPAALAQANIQTLEIVHFHFPTADSAYIDELKAAIGEAGIELFSVLIDAGDITHPDDAARAEEMAWIRSWLDVTAQCAATHARVVGGCQLVERGQAPGQTALVDHPVVQCSAHGLRHLADYGAAIGVQVITENFRETTSRADQVLAIPGTMRRSGRVVRRFRQLQGHRPLRRTGCDLSQGRFGACEGAVRRQRQCG